MPTVTFDPIQQLDLSARKVLAARLLRLIHDARMDQAAAEQTKDDKTYRDTVRAQIAATVEEDESTKDFWSLYRFLNVFGERVERFTQPYDTSTIVRSRAEMIGQLGRFNCDVCGNRDIICKGGPADRILFREEGGARCLSFLSEMIEIFVRLAENRYREIVQSPLPVAIVPEMVVQTHRKNGTAGTLPIDGEFVQPYEDKSAVVKVFWPIDDDLDSAILSLPYLIFHEVFVHGAQGAARQDVRFPVEQDCAFTEGTVDAVACRILLDEILPDEDNLPEVLRPLAEGFYSQCKRYHNDRFDPPDADSDRPGDDIRRARARGRDIIKRLLKGIGIKHKKRDPTWARRIILSLNLYIDARERMELYCLLDRLARRSAMKLALVDPLDQFDKDHDARALLDRLKKLLPVKNAYA